MSDLAKRIAELTPEKRKLLSQKLQKKRLSQQLQNNNKDTAQAQILPQKRHGNVFSLSFAQRRLWFLQQLEPQSTFYNIPSALRLTGKLHVDALERSLLALVQRHEVLRTTCPTQEDQPVQVIAPSLPIQVAVIDLHDFPAAQGTQATDFLVAQLAQQETQRPFDLTHGPLLRVSLLRLHEQEHILLFTLHHIVSDGWSTGIFMREIALLYQAQMNAEVGDKPQPYTLPALPIQYVDYTLWQRDWLQGAVLQSQLAYWREQLAGAPALLELPTDRPRPAVQRYEGVQQSFQVSLALLEQLKSLSQREGATLFMTLLATFQVLLTRYSGQTDIVVGTPIANRTREELEGLIGFFVNTLALRTDLSGNPSFLQLLARVREVALQAYAHQDVPFEKLVEELQPERDLSLQPLFQVLFSLETVDTSSTIGASPTATFALPGLSLRPVPIESRTAKFDLSLILREEQAGLQIVVEYSTDLFENATITRMLNHWQVLLEAIVRNPNQQIEMLPLLTEAERIACGLAPQAVQWNTTQSHVYPDLYLHQLFEQQVERTPDAIAVVFKEQALTYAKLNQHANQLAHHLQKLGVGPEVLVGICMERSIKMVVGLLAVLKAGGTYVPLDPTYPHKRLSLLLANAQVPFLLTGQGPDRGKPCPVASPTSLPTAPTVVDVDACWPLLVHCDACNLIDQTQTDHLAYVIFTSGTTGSPKGAGVYQKGLMNLLHWYVHELALTAQDRVLLCTSLSFDLTQKNIFAPLIVGGALSLLEPGPYDPDAILHTIVEQEITILNCTPSTFYPLLDSAENEAFTPLLHLKYLILGGEPISLPRLWSWVTSTHFQAEIINTYGPTECTDVVAYHRLQEYQHYQKTAIPLGKPIPNVYLLVLDRHLQVLPVGVVGELYLAGDCIGRGYINDPQQTGASFIANPFAAIPGTRLYKTGDLVCYLADGTLKFIGRADSQVKIRGFRIELEEIEAALNEHPAIKTVACVPHTLAQYEDTSSYKQLVAYLVANPEVPRPSSEDLRIYLEEKLPTYMIPSIFVYLNALPLSANGKVDRAALPPPGLRHHEPAFEPPREPVECTLASIWQQVLDLPHVGIHENFFALGGDSILGLQIIGRARQAGFRQLTPKQLFQHQTIAQLATVAGPMGQAQWAQQSEVIGPVLLTPIQQWFFEQDLPQPQHFNQSILLQVPASWDLRYLQSIVDALLVQHDALRLRYTYTKELGWQQQLVSVAEAGAVHVEHIDLTEGETLERVKAIGLVPTIEEIANRVQASLDLKQGPLLRVALFELGNGEPAWLLIVIHHLAIDGVSWRVLLADMQMAMTQLCKGESTNGASPTGGTSPLATVAKTVSFQRWAEHLQKMAQSVLDKDRTYWLKVTQVPTPPLPVEQAHRLHDCDLERCNIQASARTVSVTLTMEETRLLLQEAHRPYRSHIQELLLVALVQTLGRWIGTQQIRLDLEGHGREELEGETLDVSRTVGWFTSLYPVLFTLPQESEPESSDRFKAQSLLSQQIKAIKEQLRSVPHKGISYGLLRYLSEDLELQEQLASAPSSQICFNYLGQFDQRSSSLYEEVLQPVRQASGGATIGPLNPRKYILEIIALVTGGQFHLQWLYSEQLHSQTTIEELANEVAQTLRELLAHCLQPGIGGLTPSDFPLAHLDQVTLDRLLAARNHRVGPAGQTDPNEIEDIYPLTPLQQGLLFHTLYAPQSGVYIEQLSYTQRGEVDMDAIEHAWQRVIRQHEILRTALIWPELGEPLQVVYRHVTLPLYILDWRSRSPQQQTTDLKAFILADRAQGFDLEQAPLMRLTLVRLGETRMQVIWTHHHLLLDGWSLFLVLQELLACYDAEVQGKRLVLEERRPYRDYISWLQGQESETAEVYWRQALAGIVAPTPLGIDRRGASGRESVGSQGYAEEVLLVSEETTARWQDFARKQHVTLNTLIQATWALVLSRYSGQSDVVFGIVVAGRPPELAGVERMIGLFINTVPVRVQVQNEEQVGVWLTRLQKQQIEQRSYEHSSLVQVQSWCEISREQPLFESLLVFENYPVQVALEERKPVGSPYSLEVETASVLEQTNYPLTIIVGPRTKLSLQVIYDRQRFERATIQRLQEHFQTVLQQLVTDPEQILARISPLTLREREQLLVQWNATTGNYPQDLCIHQLIEQQVKQTPDAIAVVFDAIGNVEARTGASPVPTALDSCTRPAFTLHLTYRQLNDRANHLAHRLLRAEVGPDRLVGVYMERSLELVVALLAVLKAGGVYVPLDPSYPQERLAFLLEDAQVPVVLTQAHLHDRLIPFGIQAICVEPDATIETSSMATDNNPPCLVQPSNLAYMIYTSGSTGKPKGAMNTHRGLCNRLLWMQDTYLLTSEDRILQKTPFSFDVSVWEFFWPLLTGAALVVASPGGHQDPSYLRTLIAEQQITTVHFVPSMLQAFLWDQPTNYKPNLEDCISLRQVICSGEALTPELQARFFASFAAPVQLHNLYGPTEASIDVTFWPCQRESDHLGSRDSVRPLPDGYNRVPIGHPIANTQIYLLDRNLLPVPIGVTGELYIGGVGLARGYYGQPGLTAERFIPNPFISHPSAGVGTRHCPQPGGARLYRTGDLACYRADGTLEYLGRTDSQIKLRGFRIELGEIEATLRASPTVQEAVVVLREEGQDKPQSTRKYLIAYIVPVASPIGGNEGETSSPASPTHTEAPLLEYLRERLPDYMVPTKVVFLQTLPLTPNGKVDRVAIGLAPMVPERHESTFVAPRNPVERTLATIWQEVLGFRTEVSIHDNFFALGGDSILSMLIIARARQAGLRKLTLQQLLQHQTIAQLAIVAGPLELSHQSWSEQAVAIGLAPMVGPVPLTPIQHWFFEQNLPQPQHFNQAIMLQMPSVGTELTHVLQRIVNAWLSRHDALRLRYEHTEAGWQQRLVSVAEAGPVTVEEVDLTLIEAGQQESRIEAETNRVQASLDLQHGPLLRVVLFHLGNGQATRRLLIVIHHLAIDGVSWRVLLEDLWLALTQLQRGEPTIEASPMAAKTVSFQHWAQHLQELAQSASFVQKERAYWLNAAQVPPCVPLPLDFPEGSNTQAWASTVSTVLTTEETRLLLQDAPRTSRSHIQDLILVALLQTLARWMGTQQIRLDLEGHGREELGDETLDVSRTIGWFTSLYPVLFTLPQDNDASTWIKTIKEQLRSVPHKGIGYGLLRYLGGDAELKEQLVPVSPSQVSFNYLGQFGVEASAPDTPQGLQWAPESSGTASGLENPRSYLLSVDGLVVAGQLYLHWTYSEQLHRRATIEALAQEALQTLRDLLAHCLQAGAGDLIPSDFPLARLDQATLDRLLAGREGLIEDLYPLTPLQQGLLFHTLYAPQSGIYTEQVSWTLRGQLALGAFEQAWQQIITRHTILRTAFVWQELHEPLQIVFQQVKLPLTILDWRSRSHQQQQADLETFLHADCAQGFDLDQAPLMRLTLVWLGEARTQVIWTYHHLLLDGWSQSLVLQEVLACYEAEMQGQNLVYEERRLYRDYISWLAEQDGEAAAIYWRQTLAGIVSPTPLGVDQRREGFYTPPSYAKETLQIDAATTARWQKYAQQQHVTLNTLMQAAWALVLSRYSGQADVVFGIVVAGRPPELVGVEHMIGLFINTVPVRILVQAEEEVGAWLRRLHAQQLEQRAYEYSSLVEVQSWCEMHREQSLFESLLVFENYPVGAVLAEQKGQLEVEVAQVIEQTNYPLTIVVEPGAGRDSPQPLRLLVSYDCQRFERATIQRLLGHLQTVMQQLIVDPQQQLATVSLLTPTERELLLVQWNATGASSFQPTDTQRDHQEQLPWCPQDLCLHQLFEQQAVRIPDTIAVTFDDVAREFTPHLTYYELNNQANQLAHRLQQMGVGPDGLVGICMERSLELVVALLAILKAGGAYVPLDPKIPQERLTFMLKGAQISVVLTQTHLPNPIGLVGSQAEANFVSPIEMICIDSETPSFFPEHTGNPNCRVQPENLAYLIYTSGSTGKPKGVMVTHRSISNNMHWKQSVYQLKPGDSMVQRAPFSFDVSVTEIFLPLTTGARVIMAHPEGHRDSAYLLSLTMEQQVTILNLVPSLLQAFTEEPEFEQCSSLRHMLCGAEAFPAELQEQFFARHHAALCNLYGPTEATIEVTIWVCDRENVEDTVPIGRPISNTQIYLLDRNLQPVPIGVPGELYIGGMALARGYVNRPDLTAERFIPHPFVGTGSALGTPSTIPGERLYKTGDLARYRVDGAIEYLGRIDQQVKLRGFRIELDEIEAVLRQHPSVQECAVALREETEVRKYLAAYIMPRAVEAEPAPALPEASQIQEHLRKQLPDYMVPTRVVFLETMPLNPSGKVDRKALSTIDTSEAVSGRAHGAIPIAQTTPLQALLVTIWQDFLDLPRVGIHDNFFELGGHSLLATRLISRIRAVLAVEVPLRAVFEEPTVARLAKRVEQALRQDQGTPMPPLVVTARPEAFPLSFAQQRLWFLDRLEPESTAYLIPSAYRLRGEALNLQCLDRSLQELIQRHESLRTTFIEREDQPVQVIHPVGTILYGRPAYPTTIFPLHKGGHKGSSLRVIDLQGLQPEHREERAFELTRQEAHHPCDLAQGPLLRTALLRLGIHEQVLLLTLHHIISDGWSHEVLVHELLQLYRANVSGRPSPLVPLSVQYADYALWQRQWLQGKVLDEQMAYWRKQLAELSPLALPTDHPRPAVKSSQGAAQSVEISLEVSEGLLRLCRQENVTLFMTLLAAFQVLLARYSGEVDIAVGTPIANRNLAEIEGLIGFFVNTLVIRTDLSGHPTFVQLLQRVREVCLGAYANQDIPFEKVVEELEPQRDLSRTPLFQVMFILQNAPIGAGQEQGIPTQDLAGMNIEPLIVESGTSQFDLTLSCEASPRPIEQGLSCTLEYSTDLFSAETIGRMLGHWQVLLEAIVHDPGQPIETLPLLTEVERKQLLEWNATCGTVDLCLHHLFEQQVELTPEAVAVIFEEATLTYGELNTRANQLASVLAVGRGFTPLLGPDALVGVFMERSLELIVGLLAILKAGAAFVPLDPSYPAERLAWMLTDAQPVVILTQTHLMTALPATNAQFICLDTDWERITHEPPFNPTSQVVPQNLAYVMYTSGSTGRPKGVMNTHRGICNALLWQQEAYQLTQGDCLLQRTSLSFDPSLDEIFWPLIAGARIVIPRSQQYQDSSYLVSLMAQYAVTVVEIIPSILQVFIEEPGWKDCQSLRLVVSGGETLLLELQKRFFASHSASLQNTYGPTEAAIDATFWSCQRRDSALYLSDGDNCVPIGRPIANTQIYLLDRNLQPVPIGVPAELYIGGVNLARGYWNRADLTAERFIPHPFVETGLERGSGSAQDKVPVSGTIPTAPIQEGERLYRTGDLARYRPDGAIEHLGRLDQQIKLRGVRIELGEIDATLRGHPALQECVVLVRKDVPGEKRLVAYCVVCQRQPLGLVGGELAQNTIPTVPALRSYLQARLPAYMIPATFVLLDALPLTPNGKVDRRALLLAHNIGATENKTVVAPRTPVEKALAAIWTDLLNLEQVNISDNFFEVGGHSLLAVQLLNRINKQFGSPKLSLTTLFQAPTIEQAAALLQKETGPEEPHTPVAQGTQATSPSPLVTIQPVGKDYELQAKHPFFLVHDGTGDVYWSLNMAKHLRHDRPFYGIQSPGLVGIVPGVDPEQRADPAQDLFYSIEEMATFYIDKLLAIQPDGPYFLGGYSFGGLVAFEMARQLHTQGRSVALLAILDSYPTEQDLSTPAEVPGAGRGQATFPAPVRDYAETMIRIVESLNRSWKKKVSLPYEELCRLQPDEQLAYALDRLREEQVIPDDTDISQLRRYIELDEAYGYCLRSYQPKPYSGHITLFRSKVAEEDPSLWASFSDEPVEVHTVSGDHFSMVDELHVQSLTVQLQQCLDRADAVRRK